MLHMSQSTVDIGTVTCTPVSAHKDSNKTERFGRGHFFSNKRSPNFYILKITLYHLCFHRNQTQIYLFYISGNQVIGMLRYSLKSFANVIVKKILYRITILTERNTPKCLTAFVLARSPHKPMRKTSKD